MRKALRQQPRGVRQFGETPLVEHQGERHDVGAIGCISRACGWYTLVGGVAQQAFDQFFQRAACQARAARVFQHRRRAPGLAGENQRIDVTDPVLPMFGLGIARGLEMAQRGAEVFGAQRNHAQVVVGIRVMWLLPQHAAVGVLRLRQLAKPVVVRALLHQAMQDSVKQSLQILRQGGRVFAWRLILYLPVGLSYFHKAQVNFARANPITG